MNNWVIPAITLATFMLFDWFIGRRKRGREKAFHALSVLKTEQDRILAIINERHWSGESLDEDVANLTRLIKEF